MYVGCPGPGPFRLTGQNQNAVTLKCRLYPAEGPVVRGPRLFSRSDNPPARGQRARETRNCFLILDSRIPALSAPAVTANTEDG